MKKLNNKGFTLVELLAVIIILAIVVGIAIPSINGVINSAKNSSLGIAVESAADYLKDQFDIYNLDPSLADAEFINTVASGTYSGSGNFGKVTEVTATNNLFEKMGFETSKVTTVKVCVTTSGKVYVEVTKIPVNTSDYYTTEMWNTDGTAKTTATGLKNKYTGAGVATVSGNTCS